MPNEMIERVARVFCAAADKDPDKPFIDRHGATHDFPGWRDFEQYARAAIEAMREPTETMKEVAASWPSRIVSLPDQHGDTYRRMVDAALSATGETKQPRLP